MVSKLLLVAAAIAATIAPVGDKSPNPGPYCVFIPAPPGRADREKGWIHCTTDRVHWQVAKHVMREDAL